MQTWSQRVIALEAAGWSLTRLSKELGISQQALSDIKQGRTIEPRGMAAVRLHSLHEELAKAEPAATEPPADTQEAA